MTARRFAPAHPVEVVAHPATGAPYQVRWHGRAEWVTRIEETWAVDEGWWRGAPGAIRRRYFRLRTRSGLLCIVYRDLSSGCWHLEQVFG